MNEERKYQMEEIYLISLQEPICDYLPISHHHL